MLFGHSWQWFQCVSDVENLGGHEVLFEHFLPIGSEVCLPLMTVCEHEMLFGNS